MPRIYLSHAHVLPRLLTHSHLRSLSLSLSLFSSFSSSLCRCLPPPNSVTLYLFLSPLKSFQFSFGLRSSDFRELQKKKFSCLLAFKWKKNPDAEVISFVSPIFFSLRKSSVDVDVDWASVVLICRDGFETDSTGNRSIGFPAHGSNFQLKLGSLRLKSKFERKKKYFENVDIGKNVAVVSSASRQRRQRRRRLRQPQVQVLEQPRRGRVSSRQRRPGLEVVTPVAESSEDLDALVPAVIVRDVVGSFEASEAAHHRHREPDRREAEDPGRLWSSAYSCELAVTVTSVCLVFCDCDVIVSRFVVTVAIQRHLEMLIDPCCRFI